MSSSKDATIFSDLRFWIIVASTMVLLSFLIGTYPG